MLNTDLKQTPHSGYHWDGSDRRFFEGWYWRVTLPAVRQSFAFMYSIDDPGGGQPHSGGAAQILGPDETYFCRTLPAVNRFWAACDRTALGHWRSATTTGPARYLDPSQFWQQVQEGYQVTATRHQGQLQDPATGNRVVWDYETTPIYGWGQPDQPQQATAGWLSYFPIFEPGWQILMAHGLATGWIDWHGQRYCFEQAPAYAEKNWGGAFPTKWFWLQCNAFEGEPDLAVVAVGGLRQMLSWTETVGLIGVFYRSQFYPFLSMQLPLSWQIEPWGDWQLTAAGQGYRVQLHGQTDHDGGWVRVPTREGLKFICRDTTRGQLRLQLRDDVRGIGCDRTSTLAGLEIGGNPWSTVWHYP